MRDISLHLLDLAQNSIRAGAGRLEMSLRLQGDGGLDITLQDDGCGMDEALRGAADDPFVTSRTTRKVGLGLPLAGASARRTGGDFAIMSRPGEGCRVSLRFMTGHLDCLPLGALDETLLSLILSHPLRPDFCLRLASQAGETLFDTSLIRRALGPEVPLDTPDVMTFMGEMLREQLHTILGGIRD
ncbi:MAG: ATP-binding protein [Christensenellales bacterium]